MDNLSKEVSISSGIPAILETVFRIIADIVPDDSKLYLFGSFARGEERTSSDIDVAIDAQQALSRAQMVQIRESLEESNIPYTVDVVDLHHVSELLKRKIFEEGLEWTDYPWPQIEHGKH